MRDCVGEFTVCWNHVSPPPKKKLLSRITNRKHRPAVHLWGRSSKKWKYSLSVCFSLSRSDSAYVSRLADRLCEIFMMKCTFFFPPLRWLCLHTVRDLLINPLILEGHWLLITMASYKNWSLHITAEHESFPLLLQNTHTHTCCYGNTHSHLDSFSCSAAWQKPSRWEWNNTLIRQEGHGAMWPTHTNTQIPLVQTPEKRTSD